MIHVKFNDNEGLYPVKFKRISDNVVRVYGTNVKSTKGFATYSYDGEKLGDFSSYTTIYREEGEATWYSNDGSVYIEPPKVTYITMTDEAIKQFLIDDVQNYMDEVAMSRGYDSILSACSYIDTGVERFDEEGRKARSWRSQVWAYCYQYLDDVIDGKKHIPTSEELINSLPKMEW